MSATSVALRSLTKAFARDAPAVRDVDLDVAPGSLVSLLGASGCGKTTTLRMIAGLVAPTAGEVLFDGRPVTRVRPEKRPVAMVFQKALLFPHMTIGENVAYGLRLRGVDRAEVRRRVAEMLELVRLPGMQGRRPGELSGGQEQRVSLARALVVEPQVLLLDEPLSALDANLRVEMRDLVRRVQRQVGVTTVFVTHDQEEAVSLSDRIALMHDGAVEQTDPPQAFYERPRSLSVARFFGAANLLTGNVDRGVFRGAIGSLPVGSGLRSGPGVLVVRQEDVEILDGDRPGEGVLQLVVQRSQYLGTRSRVWARPAGGGPEAEMQFDTPPSRVLQPGQPIVVRVPADRGHVVPADGSPLRDEPVELASAGEGSRR
jgi:ABC-type Fe3+/spermidine/putrescine transport system ATPase subunit